MGTLIEKGLDKAKRLVGIKDAVRELHEADAGLQKELVELEAARTRQYGDFEPKDVVVRWLGPAIQRLRDAFIAQHGLEVVTALSGTLDVGPDGSVRGVSRYTSLSDVFGVLTFPALCLLLPDLVRAGLERMIRDTPYTEGSLPYSERPAPVRELIEKIEAVVQAHARLVDDASASGITLAHLPVTVGRRTQAAQARERWLLDQRANSALYRQHPELAPPEPAA